MAILLFFLLPLSSCSYTLHALTILAFLASDTGKVAVMAGQYRSGNISASACICLLLCWGKKKNKPTPKPNKKMLSDVSSFYEEINLSDHSPFGSILKYKVGSLLLNSTLCSRLDAPLFSNTNCCFSPPQIVVFLHNIRWEQDKTFLLGSCILYNL